MNILKKINVFLCPKITLLTFWTLFWLLNGLDKFFNSPTFFGVTRDEKFINYFASLALPANLALFTLYTFAILEVLLGLSFLHSLLNRRAPAILTKINFKLSMCLWIIFISGDILFGDRLELWEHSTFMVLSVVSLGLLLYTEDQDMEKEVDYRTEAIPQK